MDLMSRMVNKPFTPAMLERVQQKLGSQEKPEGQLEQVERMAQHREASPAQRMRTSVLQTLGWNEDELARLAPDAQEAASHRIADLVRQGLEQQPGGARKGSFVDVAA